MRDAWLALVLGAVVGCAAARPSRAPSSGTVRPVAAPSATGATRTPATLQKAFTGHAQPSLVVKNGLPIAQHVFIDWAERAVLAPASTQTFELSVGTHTVTCADSTDPDDHAAVVTEVFESGYAYSYDIHPGG